MKKMQRIAGLACLFAVSAQASLIYKVQVKLQTDAAVPNDTVVAGASSTGAGGGFGSDLSTNPADNGTEVSHAFSFLDVENNVNWGFTLTMTGSGNIDGSGSGLGILDTAFDPGESATFALSGLYATANNPGETANINSMLISGFFINGFTNDDSKYYLTGGGSTIPITTGNITDLGASSDASIFVDNQGDGLTDNSWKPNKLGVTADISVIPEPATLGMVALFGGSILWIRRRLMLN